MNQEQAVLSYHGGEYISIRRRLTCSGKGNPGRQQSWRQSAEDRALCKQWGTTQKADVKKDVLSPSPSLKSSEHWELVGLKWIGKQKLLPTWLHTFIWEPLKYTPHHRKAPSASTYPVPLPVSLANACHSHWVCSERWASGPAASLPAWRRHPPPEPTAGDPSPTEIPPATWKEPWWVHGRDDAAVVLQGWYSWDLTCVQKPAALNLHSAAGWTHKHLLMHQPSSSAPVAVICPTPRPVLLTHRDPEATLWCKVRRKQQGSSPHWVSRCRSAWCAPAIPQQAPLLLSHSCVSILIPSCHANMKATQMINKMESSCCHGNLKHSGQAQACTKNGLIGEDIDDWSLNHKSLAVPPLIKWCVLVWGGRRSCVRKQHHDAQLQLQLMVPLQVWGSLLGDAEERRAAEPRVGEQKQDVSGDGESKGCRALINSPWWRGVSSEGAWMHLCQFGGHLLRHSQVPLLDQILQSSLGQTFQVCWVGDLPIQRLKWREDFPFSLGRQRGFQLNSEIQTWSLQQIKAWCHEVYWRSKCNPLEGTKHHPCPSAFQWDSIHTRSWQQNTEIWEEYPFTLI